MGREVRMVPPNWEHPRFTKDDVPQGYEVGDYRRCFDKDYETAAAEWISSFEKWRAGELSIGSYCEYYWEYESPPDESLCRPKFTEPATWYQLYQTISEGSPVSPPFATKEELAAYLSEHGDFWYQKQLEEGRLDSWDSKPTYDQAMAMINAGCAPTLVIDNGKFLEPHQQFGV